MPVSISGDGGITGLELGSFEDVSGTPTDNQALTWDAATGQWVPETVTPTSLDASVIDSGVLDVARIPDVANAGIGTNVVQAVKKNTFSTTSTSPTTVTGLTATITPSSSSSKVLLIAQITVGTDSADQMGYFRFTGGNSSTYIGNSSGSRTRTVFGGLSIAPGANNYMMGLTMVYLDSPATTSSVSYSVQTWRGSVSSGTTRVNFSEDASDSNNRGRGASSLTAIEVKA